LELESKYWPLEASWWREEPLRAEREDLEGIMQIDRRFKCFKGRETSESPWSVDIEKWSCVYKAFCIRGDAYRMKSEE
jgi:hypothetical protein